MLLFLMLRHFKTAWISLCPHQCVTFINGYAAYFSSWELINVTVIKKNVKKAIIISWISCLSTRSRGKFHQRPLLLPCTTRKFLFNKRSINQSDFNPRVLIKTPSHIITWCTVDTPNGQVRIVWIVCSICSRTCLTLP